MTPKTRLALALLLATAAAGCERPPREPARADLLERMSARAEALRDDLIGVRRDLHMHPELSGQEERTAGVVAARLRGLGLEVETGVGGHGVVAVLRGGREGPVVAYRADMDAVASEVVGDPPYRSQVEGVKHVCGHDVHVAVGLGVAEAMAAVRDDLPGTVKFLFQPAEEEAAGALAMIGDGVLEDPAPQAIFAVHTAPFEVGTVGAGPGVGLSGLEQFEIRLAGEGDLDALAAEALEALRPVSTVPSPSDDFLAAFTAMMEALTVEDGPLAEFVYSQQWLDGSASEPGQRVVRGFVRASGAEAYERARREIRQAAEAVGGELIFSDQRLPDMHSDPELVAAAIPAIEAVIGEGRFTRIHASAPYFGEDFAFFQQQIPGAMFFLGAANAEKGITARNHFPDYDVDEEAVLVGVEAMASVLLDYLDSHRPRT